MEFYSLESDTIRFRSLPEDRGTVDSLRDIYSIYYDTESKVWKVCTASKVKAVHMWLMLNLNTKWKERKDLEFDYRPFHTSDEPF